MVARHGEHVPDPMLRQRSAARCPRRTPRHRPPTTPVRRHSTRSVIMRCANSGLVANSISSGTRAGASRDGILGPRLRQIQRAIDQGVLAHRLHKSDTPPLASLDASRGTGVLTLHADGRSAIVGSQTPCQFPIHQRRCRLSHIMSSAHLSHVSVIFLLALHT